MDRSQKQQAGLTRAEKSTTSTVSTQNATSVETLKRIGELYAIEESYVASLQQLPDGNASLGICILDVYQQVALNRASLHLG
ncbi:TPA: hypothetical protein MB350_001676 [Klebsiella quasipneumoniae subsp. similipneumoniae]|nr:hypothetical protein [Klebsiella quasipneumoniae subsp. similipneumoniae]